MIDQLLYRQTFKSVPISTSRRSTTEYHLLLGMYITVLMFAYNGIRTAEKLHMKFIGYKKLFCPKVPNVSEKLPFSTNSV